MEDDWFDPYEDAQYIKEVMAIVHLENIGQEDCYCTYNTTCTTCAKKQ